MENCCFNTSENPSYGKPSKKFVYLFTNYFIAIDFRLQNKSWFIQKYQNLTRKLFFRCRSDSEWVKYETIFILRMCRVFFVWLASLKVPLWVLIRNRKDRYRLSTQNGKSLCNWGRKYNIYWIFINYKIWKISKVI